MKITRRRFISTTIAGATGIALNRSLLANKIIKYTAPDPFELVNLGKTGIKVSEIGFGAWGIGGLTENATSYGKTDDNESRRSLEKAYEKGINLYDTSNVYGDGHSEKLIGETFEKVRDKIINIHNLITLALTMKNQML